MRANQENARLFFKQIKQTESFLNANALACLPFRLAKREIATRFILFATLPTTPVRFASETTCNTANSAAPA
jgi:hypothetical protein